MGVHSVVVFPDRSSGAADTWFARSAVGSCLSSLSRHRAARVPCGLMVRHARLTSRRVTCHRIRLCRSPFCVLSYSTQRESSAARAHDTIGAGRLKRLLGVRFRRRGSGFFFRGGRRPVRHVGRRRLLSSSLPLRRAARLSCGLTVRHARLSTAASPVTSSRLCRSWSSGFRVLPSSVTQRESSAARAHEAIGAGRLKRLFGVRSVIVFLRAACVADAPCDRSAVRLSLPWLPLRRAARLSCGLTVRHARLSTAASPSPHRVFAVLWFSCSSVYSTERSR